MRVRSDRSRLQLAFLKKQRANLEAEIEDLQQEAKLVEAQIPVDEELLAKGLVTRQQTYATQQRLGSIQGSIASRRAEISQIDALEFQTANESVESNLQAENNIADLTREVSLLENELEAQTKVVTPHAGQVLEVKVSPGSLVQAGTPVISLQPDVVNLESILYVPARRAEEVGQQIMRLVESDPRNAARVRPHYASVERRKALAESMVEKKAVDLVIGAAEVRDETISDAAELAAGR